MLIATIRRAVEDLTNNLIPWEDFVFMLILIRGCEMSRHLLKNSRWLFTECDILIASQV